jgi:hypothetical protein
VSPPPAVGSEPARRSFLREAAAWALLWAGPLGIGLAALLLLASAPFFRHGPGVPSAGDERAWNAMWGALGLVAVGCSVGLVANLAWLSKAILSRRRPRTIEWVRGLTGIALGAAFAVCCLRG